MKAADLATATGARIDRAAAWLVGAFQALEYVFFWHSPPHPLIDTRGVNAKGTACRSNTGVINSINGDRNQNTFVLLALLLLRCPTHISGLVVPMFIKTVNGVAISRHSPHIRKKSREVLNPWSKNSDSFSAIRRPSRGLGVEASLLHARPASVFWAAGISRCMAMFSHFIHSLINKRATKGFNPFFAKASARFGLAVSEFASPCNFFISALALAKPSGPLSRRGKNLANNGKPAIYVARQINFIHAGIIAKHSYGVQA